MDGGSGLEALFSLRCSLVYFIAQLKIVRTKAPGHLVHTEVIYQWKHAQQSAANPLEAPYASVKPL